MREAKHVAVDKEIKPALRQPNPAIDSDTKRGREIEASALSAGLFREPRTVERKEETDLRTHTSTSLEMRMAAWREAAWTRVSGLQRERVCVVYSRGCRSTELTLASLSPEFRVGCLAVAWSGRDLNTRPQHQWRHA